MSKLVQVEVTQVSTTLDPLTIKASDARALLIHVSRRLSKSWSEMSTGLYEAVFLMEISGYDTLFCYCFSLCGGGVLLTIGKQYLKTWNLLGWAVASVQLPSMKA